MQPIALRSVAKTSAVTGSPGRDELARDVTTSVLAVVEGG